MPSTAGVTIGLPPARAALEAVQRSVRLRRAYTISNAQKQETRWGAAFPGNIGPMLMIGVTGSPFGATAARFSRHLPVTSQHLLLSDRLLEIESKGESWRSWYQPSWSKSAYYRNRSDQREEREALLQEDRDNAEHIR